MRGGLRVGLVTPALDEERAIGRVVRFAPEWVDRVVVADNGSRDATAREARAAGALVVVEDRRGYGYACLAGLEETRDCDVIVFCDGDASDDLTEMLLLVDPILAGTADLVVGSRVRGRVEKGALTPVQRSGNALACSLLDLRWGPSFTDLGPLRAVGREALEALCLTETGYGWTVEMQAKALRARLPVGEVAVSYRRRVGISKISGTVRGVVGAGSRILWVVAREALRTTDSSGLRPLSRDRRVPG